VAALQSFVNILSGGSTFPAFYRYTEDSLIYRTNKLGIGNSAIKGSLQTNVKNMYISFPHPDDVANVKVNVNANSKSTGIVQPDITSFILDRSIQFIPLRAYLKDPNLTKYINMFDAIGTPVVPMSHVYKNLTN
jgi:hypothetical protein